MDYTINSGDSLSAIAKKYNTDIPTLMGANKQISNPNMIIAGSKITVPDAAKPTAAVAASPNTASPNTGIASAIQSTAQPQGVGIRDYLSSQGHNVDWTAANGVTVDSKKIDTTGWANIGGKMYATTDQIQTALNNAGVAPMTKMFNSGTVASPVATPVKPAPVQSAPVQAAPVAPAAPAKVTPAQTPVSLRTAMSKNYDVGWDGSTGTVLIDKVPIDVSQLTRDANGSYMATPEQIANIEKGFVGLRQTLEKAGYKNIFQDPITGAVTADGKVINTSALKLSTQRSGEKRWVGTAEDVQAAVGAVNLPAVSDPQKVQDKVVSAATNDEVLSADKLTQIYNAINALMPQQKDIAPAITYQEGLTQAGEQLNPIYDQQMIELNKNIDNRDAISGWLGQVPANVMKRSSQIQENAIRTSKISELANQLVAQSQNNANTQKQLSQTDKAQNMDWIKTALNTLTTKEQNQFLNAISAGNFLSNKETTELNNESTRIKNSGDMEALRSLPIKTQEELTQLKQQTSLNTKKLIGQDIANKIDQMKLDAGAIDLNKLKEELKAGEIANAIAQINLSTLPEKIKLELEGMALGNRLTEANIVHTLAAAQAATTSASAAKSNAAVAAAKASKEAFDDKTMAGIKAYGDYIEKNFYKKGYDEVTEKEMLGNMETSTTKRVENGKMVRDETDTKALAQYITTIIADSSNDEYDAVTKDAIMSQIIRVYGMADNPDILQWIEDKKGEARVSEIGPFTPYTH